MLSGCLQEHKVQCSAGRMQSVGENTTTDIPVRRVSLRRAEWHLRSVDWTPVLLVVGLLENLLIRQRRTNLAHVLYTPVRVRASEDLHAPTACTLLHTSAQSCRQQVHSDCEFIQRQSERSTDSLPFHNIELLPRTADSENTRKTGRINRR